MAWYQTQSSLPLSYKKLLTSPAPPIADFLNSQQFLVQLTKHSNPETVGWVNINYIYFFEELLNRALLLPKPEDSECRKFKEPMMAVSMLVAVVEGTDIAGMGTTAAVGASIGASSGGVVGFVVEKMFAIFMQNNPKEIQNTLIPGHFHRIFQSLNRCHSPVFNHTLRTSPSCKLDKLLQVHGKQQQISRCIQSLLIVFISQAPTTQNLQVSVSTQINATVPIPVPVCNNGPSQQQNHPYQIKYRLLMHILQKIRAFQSIDVCLLDNVLAILLEIVRNVYVIFQGTALVEYACQGDNVNAILDIALGGIKGKEVVEGVECQEKALQIMKYCIHLMTMIDRTNISPYFQQFLHQLTSCKKPTITSTLTLQLISEWFIIESGQQTMLFITNPNLINRSMGSSMNSSRSFNESIVNPQFNPQFQNALTGGQVFRKLLNLCVRYPNSNIFQQRVANFMGHVFKSQSIPIIQSIFKQNNVIGETITNLQDFKANPYFGYFIIIIEIYTSRRVDTPTVNQAIQHSKDSWNNFYNQILEPHVSNKLRNKLGEMANVTDGTPLEFEVVKAEQQSVKDKEKQKEKQKQKQKEKQKEKEKEKQKSLEQSPLTDSGSTTRDADMNISPIKLNFDSQKPKESEDVIEQISIKFDNKDAEAKEDKGETESFQSFLKKKMVESNKLVQERRNKSRTPTKMISGSSKRNKWGAENESESQSSAKKPVSTDEKFLRSAISPPPKQQLLPKLKLIKTKAKKPTKIRQRKMNKEQDGILMKWMEKLKTNVRAVR